MFEEARTFLQVALNYAKVASDHGQTEGQEEFEWHKNLVGRAVFNPTPPLLFTEAKPPASVFSQRTKTLFLLPLMSRATAIIQLPTRSYFVFDISSV